MKTFKFFILFLFFLSLFMLSCTEDEQQVDFNETILTSRFSIDSARNYYYVDTTETVSFSSFTQVNTDSIESLLDSIDMDYIEELFNNPNSINLHVLNLYLDYIGESRVDVWDYVEEGNDLISDDNLSFDTLMNYFSKYNVYNQHQIGHLKSLNTAVEAATNDSTYNLALTSFISSVSTNSNLSSFEKFTLISFGRLMIVNEQSVSSRGDCYDCIKKKRWKIFGFSLLMYIFIVLACIVSSGGSGLLACLLGVIPFSVFNCYMYSLWKKMQHGVLALI